MAQTNSQYIMKSVLRILARRAAIKQNKTAPVDILKPALFFIESVR